MRAAGHSVLTWLLALGGSAFAAATVVTVVIVAMQPASSSTRDSIVADETATTSGGPLPRVVVGQPTESADRSPLAMSLKDGEPGHLVMPLKGQSLSGAAPSNTLHMCLKHDLRSGDPVCERDLPRIHMALR